MDRHASPSGSHGHTFSGSQKSERALPCAVGHFAPPSFTLIGQLCFKHIRLSESVSDASQLLNWWRSRGAWHPVQITMVFSFSMMICLFV